MTFDKSAAAILADRHGRSSSEEIIVNWNKRIRQFHRWVSIAFTVTVIAAFIALAQEEPAVWVSYLPLLPLALLLFTGLYLFALPYTAKWRGRRSAAREA
ncbi:hypothetical protein [Umezawaea sp. Da 62-37]|uniref:hypothetical protein n=1 Tax=Umezawaea sp. Da 62-37 TaxID=3075927 RepID=UPI0028F71E20|nr:hypothetical protein [Umezawaea sp. Da 62-37]WNV86914.1 hypothetical protein RM788_01085 [Umezawaea sp. Da 62-37]